MKSLQPEFALKDWARIFPLNDYSDCRHNQNGPADLCYIEQIRARARRVGHLGPSVETDVFVLGLGEPKERCITKIGGMPYRPDSLPWPRSAETGNPLTFVVQFCFCDSRDIVGKTPSDVLLLFFEDSIPYDTEGFSGPPVCEWYPTGLRDLVRPEQIPATPFRVPVCFGARRRSVDYVRATAVEVIADVVPNEFLKRWEDRTHRERALLLRAWLLQMDKLKIGGCPFWRFPRIAGRKAGTRSRFIGTIPNVFCDNEGVFRWFNYRNRDCKGDALVWHDYGLVHLYLRDDGVVVPRFEFYGLWDPR